MLGKSISQNSLILGAFAAVTAGLIAATFQGTEARIAESERRAAQKALFQIVPQTRHNNDMLSDTVELSDSLSAELGFKNPVSINIARHDQKPIAMVIPTIAPDGYSGDIKLIVGVNTDGTVAGVRVLSHKETPGLGDRADIAKSPWVLEFNGKSLTNPTPEKWKVKKDGGDFDQFTGATITPRAIVRAVKNALEIYQQQQQTILQQATNTEAQ